MLTQAPSPTQASSPRSRQICIPAFTSVSDGGAPSSSPAHLQPHSQRHRRSKCQGQSATITAVFAGGILDEASPSNSAATSPNNEPPVPIKPHPSARAGIEPPSPADLLLRLLIALSLFAAIAAADPIHGCGGFVEASSALIKSIKVSDSCDVRDPARARESRRMVEEVMREINAAVGDYNDRAESDSSS